MKRLRCAIYTRKSTEEGLDQDYNSLEAQRDSCEAYIKSQASEGWTAVKKRYDDGGISGATMERPALQQLLADIDARKVDVVVVYKVDRLTRSLSDFAKMVDQFDHHGVSFVSVTQQFNTTNSMGRLTLNVLLSFAQFEREVTAERIRDKIAASKKKGMWMGGVVPLGYDVKDRKLVVNEAEAKIVRTLFDLYTRLGTVNAVKEEADRLGLRTKARKPNNGKRSGGDPFRPGHLYKLLSNRMYIGEIVHKGTGYPGEHKAIVDREVWDAVQEQLRVNAVQRRAGSNAKSPSLLTGLLWDANGTRMKPSHANKAGQRYRYYISHEREDRISELGSTWRLPAPALEDLVLKGLCSFLANGLRLTKALDLTGCPPGRLKDMVANASRLSARFGTGDWTDTRQLLLEIINRIDIRPSNVRITLDAEALRSILANRQGHQHDTGDRTVSLDIPVQLRRRGAEIKFVLMDDRKRLRDPDPNLITAVIQGHRWFEELRTGIAASVGDLVRRHGVHQGDISRTLPLAFLAPDIFQAILDGKHPIELTAARLKRIRLPQSWAEQRHTLGFVD